MQGINLNEVLNRLRNFETILSGQFVGREKEVEAILISAIAQEPLLLVGPPGTGKSQLIVRFRQLLGIMDSEYFEYMLTKFTEPSEILGPLDLRRMKSGEYHRKTAGKLPEAKVVFLDEVFKSNSAILNSLLTILNERKFYQDGHPVPVPLKILLAATNEIPAVSDLDALKDRFVLKVPVERVSQDRWEDLLQAGFRQDRATSQVYNSVLDLQELESLHEYFMETLRELAETGNDPFFPPGLYMEFKRLIRSMMQDYSVELSDRKLIKFYKLIRARALLRRGGGVEREDLKLLCYAGNLPEELEFLKVKIPELLD